MTREQLEHLLRASIGVLQERAPADGELVVIGSQAILGQFPDASSELLRSMEADLYPRHAPELADVIDGAIGEGSAFHDTFGYYAQGVGPETAILPDGWLDRVFRVESPAAWRAVGLCLEVHDLAISKYVAGREKDLEFTRELARLKMTKPTVLRDRLAHTPVDAARRKLVRQRISLHFPGASAASSSGATSR
jgi:hypothetical protein